MRLSIAISGLVAVLAFTQTASAADLAARVYTKAPMMQSVYNWTGFYVGAHLGGAWSDTTASGADRAALIATYGGVPQPRGVFGGGQVGYNYQFQNNVVLGVEAAGGGGPGYSDTVSIPGVSRLRSEGDWYALLGGRLGYAIDRWLPYVVGGGAWAENHADALTPFGTGTFRNTHNGYYVGGGLEYGITQNVSVGVEYRFLSFERKVYGGVSTGSDMSTVVGKLNYRF